MWESLKDRFLSVSFYSIFVLLIYFNTTQHTYATDDFLSQITEQDVLLTFYFEHSVRLMQLTVFTVTQGHSTSPLENPSKTLDARLNGLAVRHSKRGTNELASVAVSS